MILGLDLGTTKTGVALGDGRVAQEYTTLNTDDQFIDRLRIICTNERVERIVIGLPIKENGQPSNQTEWVRLMGEKITSGLKLPVVYINELLTSVEARRLLEQQQLQPAQVEARIDQLAARLILEQSFHLSSASNQLGVANQAGGQ